MDADDCFAHRISGAIDLMKMLIAKQAIAMQNAECQLSLKRINLDQREAAFIGECITQYNKILKRKNMPKLTDDEEQYGADYALSEIAELIEERVQRKIDLNLAFVQIIRETRARRAEIKGSVTGG